MFDHIDTVASVNANLRNETKNLLENGFDISKSKNMLYPQYPSKITIKTAQNRIGI